MFEKSLERIDIYFCDNTNYKKLLNTFDDRYSDYAYLVKELDGITEFEDFAGHNNRVLARKKYKLYLQYKGAFNQGIIEGLLYTVKCSGENIIEMNTDSKFVFEEITGQKMKSDTFGFAYIVFEFKDVLAGKICNLC